MIIEGNHPTPETPEIVKTEDSGAGLTVICPKCGCLHFCGITGQYCASCPQLKSIEHFHMESSCGYKFIAQKELPRLEIVFRNAARIENIKQPDLKPTIETLDSFWKD